MASATVHVSSSTAFATLLKTSRIVVVDFYADWCGPCKQIAPIFEQLSQTLSKKNQITFAKVDTDNQKELAAKYNITTLPTFMVFRGGEQVEKLGPEPRKLADAVKKLVAEMNSHGTGSASDESDEYFDPTQIVIGNIPLRLPKTQLQDFLSQHSLPLPEELEYQYEDGVFQGTAYASFLTSSDTQHVIEVISHAKIIDQPLSVQYRIGGGSYNKAAQGSDDSEWRRADLPKGFNDVTDQVDLKGLELLNSDSEFGGVRTLVDSAKPSALTGESKKDWVESDTDEQLMLFMPFQARLKIHTLQLTSCTSSYISSNANEEIPMRPKTLNLYTNTPHILGFEEAEGIPATQSITLSASDWDATGTANIPLRFVKFQNVTSLVLFVVDGDGKGERVRIDRIRIIGETGEKRDQGKLEKIDHDH